MKQSEKTPGNGIDLSPYLMAHILKYWGLLWIYLGDKIPWNNNFAGLFLV